MMDNENTFDESSEFASELEENGLVDEEQSQPTNIMSTENTDNTVESELQERIARLEQELNARAQLDPLIMQAVLQPQQQQQAQVEPPKPPVKPEPPVMPDNFNREDAFSDPSSPSARYLAAKEDYLARMVEYQNTVLQQTNQTLSSLYGGIQQMEEQQRRQAGINSLVQELQIKHGFSPMEASEFIRFADSPDAYNLKNLVALYKYATGKIQPQTPPQPRQGFTPPAASGGSGGVANGSTDNGNKSFLDSLIRVSRNGRL